MRLPKAAHADSCPFSWFLLSNKQRLQRLSNGETALGGKISAPGSLSDRAFSGNWVQVSIFENFRAMHVV
jgi:hypothetical protein